MTLAYALAILAPLASRRKRNADWGGHLPPGLRVAAITEAAADRLAIILDKPVSDPESMGAVETVDESVLLRGLGRQTRCGLKQGTWSHGGMG